MPKQVKVDGKIITVPDDATPDEIDAIASGGQAPDAPAPARQYTGGIDTPEDLHAAGNFLGSGIATGGLIGQAWRGAGSLLTRGAIGRGLETVGENLPSFTEPLKPIGAAMRAAGRYIGKATPPTYGRAMGESLPTGLEDMAFPAKVGARATPSYASPTNAPSGLSDMQFPEKTLAPASFTPRATPNVTNVPSGLSDMQFPAKVLPTAAQVAAKKLGPKTIEESVAHLGRLAPGAQDVSQSALREARFGQSLGLSRDALLKMLGLGGQ